LTFILALVSTSAIAVNSLSIFYPPPFQQDGVFYSAKKLFPTVNGGLWTLDNRGDIRFYDGQHMLPRHGSVVAEKVRDAVYIDKQFWFISDDTLFRVTPSRKAITERVLPTHTGLRRIGHTGRDIWISDAHYFYVYNTVTERLQSYALKEVAKQVGDVIPEINHAVKLPNRWVIATTAGVFSLIDGAFTLVESSLGKHVEVYITLPDAEKWLSVPVMVP
jgi:AraC family chitin signaling transcriptional activator